MIFGNIRNFATDEILSKCDKFLGHGHFSLHRTINNEYEKIVESVRSRGIYDNKYVYTHEEPFAIDEYDHLGLSYTYLIAHNDRFYSGYTHNNNICDVALKIYPNYVICISSDSTSTKRIYNDIHTEITHFRDRVNDKITDSKIVLYSYKMGTLNRLINIKNKISYEEILYIHFPKRKMKICYDDINNYMIVPNKFLAYNENPTFGYFWLYGRSRFIDFRNLRSRYNKFKTDIKLFLLRKFDLKRFNYTKTD